MSLKAEFAQLRNMVDRLRAAKPAADVPPSEGSGGGTADAGTPFEAILDGLKATMSELDSKIERFHIWPR
jgi:hypothetical protein